MMSSFQLPPDLHVHTEYSIDAEGKQLQCLDAAIRLKLPGIGFAEHWDFDPEDPSTGSYDYRKQRDGLMALADLTLGEATVFFGTEISYRKIYEADIRREIEGKDFDYVIGSLHHAGDIWVGRLPEMKGMMSADEIYYPYFAEYLDMVESGMFDIAGHLDYPKRYCHGFVDEFRYEDYSSLIDPILEAILKNGMTIEINTGGLRRKVNEQYPSARILNRYKSLGGKYVTFGSDAHNPAEVGADFGQAMGLVKNTGLRPVVYAAREKVPI